VKHLENIIISTIILAVTKHCGSDAATSEMILKLFFFQPGSGFQSQMKMLEAFCHFVTNAQTNLSGTPDGCQDN
jgi:hypothetical protein